MRRQNILMFLLALMVTLASSRKLKRTTNLLDVLEDIAANPRVLPDGRFARAYNNPFHPEDDVSMNSYHDDNLPSGLARIGELSDHEKTEQAQVQRKKMKINGKYFDTEHPSPDDAAADINIEVQL